MGKKPNTKKQIWKVPTKQTTTKNKTNQTKINFETKPINVGLSSKFNKGFSSKQVQQLVTNHVHKKNKKQKTRTLNTQQWGKQINKTTKNTPSRIQAQQNQHMQTSQNWLINFYTLKCDKIQQHEQKKP